jgi:NAD(P)-dependent dehydrogenase (short-subunit alcohol dehydrogenase family)
MSKNQNVLITGSSSGFGFLTARTLLEKGYTVFATMRDLDGKNAAQAKDLRDSAGGKKGTLRILDLDVTSDMSVDTAVQKALNEVGYIDVVINNAGIGMAGFAEGFTVDQLQRIFDVNVFGIQRVNRAVLPAMRERGSGLLIHVSSSMGRLVIPFAAPYTATKYAVEGLAESYRYELAGTGVDVVVVEPGGFGTGFASNMAVPADEVRVESYGKLKEIPQQMWGGFVQQLQGENAPDPQVVADAILTLIETPAGQRPLRTVVDPMTGGEAASAINQTTDQIQSQLLGAFGMGDLLSVNGGH